MGTCIALREGTPGKRKTSSFIVPEYRLRSKEGGGVDQFVFEDHISKVMQKGW